MGYLRRPIRRRRCASQVATALARQDRAGATGWFPVPVTPPPPSRQTIYLRFAVGRIDHVSREQLGVFQAAYELRDDCGCASDAARMLQPLFEWFDENLHAPSVSEASVFWFKSVASRGIVRICEIVHVLTADDAVVWMMRCR